jgi:hypothetical protein
MCTLQYVTLATSTQPATTTAEGVDVVRRALGQLLDHAFDLLPFLLFVGLVVVAIEGAPIPLTIDF